MRRHVQKELYQEAVRNIVSGRSSYVSDSISMDKYIVQYDKEIGQVYKKGIDSLLVTYFSNNVAKIPFDNKGFMASVLFENCIISWVDDYSGSMVIKTDYYDHVVKK